MYSIIQIYTNDEYKVRYISQEPLEIYKMYNKLKPIILSNDANNKIIINDCVNNKIISINKIKDLLKI